MTEYVASIVKTVTDGEQARTYISPILGEITAVNDEEPTTDIQLIEKIIESIKYIEGSLGLFSSKIVNYCEFDKKITDDIMSYTLKCGEIFSLYYPYNMVQADRKNFWKFKCLEQYYIMQKKLLLIKPNSVSNIVNIKRSSGIIQKAFINKNNYIGFYKTSNDNYKDYHLGVQVVFKKQGDVDEETDINMLEWRKIILFKDIIELNPEFKNIEITYNLIDYKDFLEKETFESNNIIENVVSYFNNIYLDWINNTVKNELTKFELHINKD